MSRFVLCKRVVLSDSNFRAGAAAVVMATAAPLPVARPTTVPADPLKDAFNAYADESGAKALLAEALVALTNAWRKGEVDLHPGPVPWLRDWAHTDAGRGKTQGPVLSDAEKEQLSKYLRDSGAYDLLTKALIELYELADRPQEPLIFYKDFFVRQAGPYVPQPPRAKKDRPVLEPTAPAAQPAEPAAAAEPGAAPPPEPPA